MTFSPGRPSDRRTTACQRGSSQHFHSRRHTWKAEGTYVFPRDLPARLLLVELLSEFIAIGAEADDDVALDRTQTANLRSTGRGRHRPDGDLEVCRWRRGTIVGELAVVEVALEEDEVGAREVEEQIRSLVVELPEGVTRAPEGVLLVHPLALLLVLLTTSTSQHTWPGRT